MDLKTLRAQLQKLAALADGWDASCEIADIERDLALEKLRELYDAVRFGLDPEAGQSPVEEPLPVDLPPVEIDLDAVIGLAPVEEFTEDETPVEQPPAESPIFEPAAADGAAVPFAGVSNEDPLAVPTEASAGTVIDPLLEVPLGMPVESMPAVRTDTPAEEPAVSAVVDDPVAEAVAATAPVASELPVETGSEIPPVVSEHPVADAEPLSLFELDPVDVKRAKHRVVLSLYGDTEPVESARAASGKVPVEPVVEEPQTPVSQAAAASSLSAEVTEEEPAAVEPAEHPVVPAENGPAVLGETLNADVTTVSDMIAVTAPPAAVGQEPVVDLRKALCNNDRFLLARDLFGGDMALCEQTIDRLNEFDDLDECMIYIAENFDWNPNSDGAKLLVELIERKLA